ncbi:MAG: S-layer homology domain-containing protein [Nodosilinea sp.]
MVNLPPDPNDSRRRDQILSFDELLAVVLALLGIGAILWWGMGRDRGPLANAELGRRSVDSNPGLFSLGDEPVPNEFEPRVFEDGGRTERPPQVRDEVGLGRGLVVDRTGAVATTPVVPAPVPVPAAPNAVPAPPAPVETTQPLDISDVPPDHWVYPFIQPMYDQGFLPDLPSGQFQPDKVLTRAELAALLNQAFESAPAEGQPFNFSDVPSPYWAAEAIDQVVAEGFMSGYPEGDFRPDQTVPRYEVIVSLATGLGLTLPADPNQALQAFSDTDTLPDWATPKVAAATENTLVVNYPNPNQLNPDQPATRAEIVAMIHQALVQQGKLEPVESAYVVEGR